MRLFLNPRPRLDDWMKLKLFMPNGCKQLIELCIQYHQLKERINVGPGVEEFGTLNILIQTIISEYKGLVKKSQYSGTSKDMDAVEKDIKSILSRFLGREGKIRLDDIQFKQARESDSLDVYFESTSNIFEAFVISRIYLTFKDIVENKLSRFIINEFGRASLQKAGIYPLPREKEEALLPKAKGEKYES